MTNYEPVDRIISARPSPTPPNVRTFPLTAVLQASATDLAWQLSPGEDATVRRCGGCTFFRPIPGKTDLVPRAGWCINPTMRAARGDLVLVHERYVRCPEYAPIDPEEAPVAGPPAEAPMVEAPFALAPPQRAKRDRGRPFFGRWAKAIGRQQ